jgi:hypothetical protein
VVSRFRVLFLVGFLAAVVPDHGFTQEKNSEAPARQESPASAPWQPASVRRVLLQVSGTPARSFPAGAPGLPPWRFSVELLPRERVLDQTPVLPDGPDFRSPQLGSRTQKGHGGFRWGPALRQSAFFMTLEHGARLAFDPPTRQGLKGHYWENYVASVMALKHWRDGDPWIINYVGHPIQGSISSFIYIQNDPRSRNLEFAWSRDYWSGRLRATLWNSAYSTYFELGFPISEASLGHVGVGTQRKARQGWVDLVITPTLGAVWLVTEDVLERYVVHPQEFKHQHPWSRALLRSLLTPSRSFANMLRFKEPWFRDSRSGVTGPVNAPPTGR